jgi:hypothetical protein
MAKPRLGHRKLFARMETEAATQLLADERIVAVGSGDTGNAQAAAALGGVAGHLIHRARAKSRALDTTSTTGLPIGSPTTLVLTNRRLLCWQGQGKKISYQGDVPVEDIESIQAAKSLLSSAPDGRLTITRRGYEGLKLRMLAPSMAQQIADEFAGVALT